MTYNLGVREDFAVPLPITEHARHLAQEFASQQLTPAKAQQVWLNTLAVLVVNDYLQMMSIPTNLPGSDSWNQLLRLCTDVADLELPEVGRLECRPVRQGAHSCPIPPEVWDLRMGYVVIEIDDQGWSANLLGFVPSAEVEELSLTQLRSPEELLDHIYAQRQAIASLTAQTTITPQPVTTTERINLAQWLEGLFAASWQTVESLLNPPQLTPEFAFRSPETLTTLGTTAPIRRAKLISWGGELSAYPLVLVVEVTPDNTSSPQNPQEQQIRLLLQLYSVNLSQLPSGVQLMVLDETGGIFLQAGSRNSDQYLQLQFSGTAGEAFAVQISLGNAVVTEEFVI